MSWDTDGDYIAEEPEAVDLTVLHRWELLHLIWEPIALGASGRVLSVLFRVLPPGRPLLMSMGAVAREAGVTKQTVVRVYKALRAARILVTAKDGKPTVNYDEALDAAIRSVASRPSGELERRLARLQEIAGAMGTGVNTEFIDAQVADYDADPDKRLPGRQRRKRKPRRTHAALERTHVMPDRPHAVPDRTHGVSASDARCAPELNLNGVSNPKGNWNANGASGGASRPLEAPHTDQPSNKLGPIQTEYGGQPTLIARALELIRRRPVDPWTRFDIAVELDVLPGEAGRVLRDLRQRGYAERIGHGRYMLTEAARSVA
jgi:DNA-binding transcriptional regulator YhcF (GntR family)